MPKIPLQVNILFKIQRKKPLSCAHNSVTAHILRQMNPRYILLHIYFGSISIIFYSQKSLTWPAPIRSSEQKFKWAPQLWHMYQKYRTFRPPWISTLIINECTYYNALLYAVFSSFPLYPQSYSHIFSPATPHLWQPDCEGWSFI